MKTLFFASALAACSAFAGARIETLENDLSKKLVPGSLEITADADTTVRGRFLFAGGEYNTAGWTGLLFVGVSGEGVTFTNSAAGRGFMSWDIPATMTPTNGRYAFQIFGAQGARMEEWARGAVTVRGNPGKTALPVEWVKMNPVYVIATNALKIAQDASGAAAGAMQAATLADATARAASVTGGLAYAQALSAASASSVADGIARAASVTGGLAIATAENAFSFARTNLAFRIFNPSDVSEFIDGAGNKYQISNFWEISFGADFQNQYGYDPTNATYLITAYGQNIHELDPYMPGLRYWNIGYGPTYNMGNNDGFYVEFFPGGFYSNGWYPTTNNYVLNAAQQTGAQGTAYVRHFFETNLVGTVALLSDIPPPSSGLPSVWTNMTWGATGTNALYRMSWDVTNGTIKVEEILP